MYYSVPRAKSGDEHEGYGLFSRGASKCVVTHDGFLNVTLSHAPSVFTFRKACCKIF
jgi:hypothetical protein